MIKTTQPALHGDQHCPDGSDPIPCLITPPASFDTYPDAVLAHPCLVHYWPADEPSGSLIDRKGTANLSAETTTVSGVGYPQYAATGPFSELPELTAVVNAGNYGASGHDGHFYNTSITLPTATAPYTIELWIYATSYGTADAGSIFETGGHTIVMLAKKLWATKGAVNVIDPADFPLATWQYVVARYDGTTLALFRNAALVASQAAISASSSVPLSWLNNHTGPSYNPWNGRSAQFAIYNCALTDDEIAAHYALRDIGPSGPAGLVPTTDGEGGTTWAFPTVKVDGTRYDEILAGTGLTSTDNTDGTVTLDATAGTIAPGSIGPTELASTAVTAATYGDATHVGQFTVDADGRLTAASNVAITGAAGTGQHILLADGRANPFAFTDMLQMDDGTDFMWTDPE